MPPFEHTTDRPQFNFPEDTTREGLSEDAEISPLAIEQNEIPNCFYQAALASLANSDKGREAIEQMIVEKPDGSQLVKFPGVDEVITLSKEEISQSASSNQAPWAVTLETAFLKYNTSGGAWRSLLSTNHVGPLGRVRTTREAMKLLTGDTIGVSQFGFTDIGNLRLSLGASSKESVEEQLKWGVEHQSVMTAGANLHLTKFLGENDPRPLTDMHVFSVLDYDDDKKTVTVYNPHGHNSGFGASGSTTDGITNLGDGKLSMSLDTFISKFGDLNVSGRSDARNLVDNLVGDAANLPQRLNQAGTQIVEGHPIDASVTLAEAAAAVPSTMLNGATNYMHTVGGYAADHPREFLFFPPLPALVTGVTQFKELSSAVANQVSDLKRAIFD